MCNRLDNDRLIVSLHTCSSLAPSPLSCPFLFALAAVQYLLYLRPFGLT